MIPAANQNFSGWIAYQGASVTVTQGQTPMVVDSMDYLPFGEQIAGSWGSTHKFTGKERDSETGLDYFGARYDGSALGRFMTPDPLMASAHVSDPQSWNRYTYARNSPLSYFDPTGLKEETADACAKNSHCVTVKINVVYDKNANGGKGLTDKQKEAFGNQLQKAKDEYGNAHVHFDVTYSTGTMGDAVKGAENLIVSDHTSTGDPGVSAFTSKGYAISQIDETQADIETVSHEITHQVLGDTTGLMNKLMQYDQVGLFAAMANGMADVANDGMRSDLATGRENSFHMGRDTRPNATPFEGWNQHAREFQDILNKQAAIKPQQK